MVIVGVPYSEQRLLNMDEITGGSPYGRKRDMVDGMIAIHRTRFAVSGLEFVLGEGRFIAPSTIEVRLAEGGTRRVAAERVFLNLGTHATIPKVPGLTDATLRQQGNRCSAGPQAPGPRGS
jgi:pyruvate/2-oxoglutarate dehydrogenase complex dihydrolipoamide dehydrogenase (E3) component